MSTIFSTIAQNQFQKEFKRLQTIKELTKPLELDIATDIAMLADSVAPHGTIAVYGTSAGETTFPIVRFIANSLSVRFLIVYELQPEVRATAIAGISALLVSGQLSPSIGKRFPLTRIAEAHEVVAQGKVIGNVVVVDIQV